MSCLYCGSPQRFETINVCVCGRSGTWDKKYHPKLIECEPCFDTPEWLRFIRRIWYSLFPVNGPIIEAAMQEAEQDESPT